MDFSQRGGDIVSPHMKAFQFLVRLSRQFLRYAVPAIVCVSLAETAGVSTSYIMKMLVDALEEDVSGAWSWAFVYIGIYVFSEVCWRSSGYIGMLWITKARSLASFSLYNWLSRHSSSYFSDRFSGALATKITNASNGVSDILPQMLWNFYPTLLMLFLSIVLAYWAKPMLALLLGIWCFLFLIFNSLMVRKKARLSEAAARSYTSLKGQLVDIITNIRAVHQFAHLKSEKARVKRYINRHEQNSLRSWRYSEGLLLTNNGLQSILLAGMLLTAIWLKGQGLLTLGEVVMVVNLTWGILEALLFIGNSLNNLMESYGEIQEGLDEILQEHEIVDPQAQYILQPKGGEIVFKDVCFGYTNDKSVFHNFNLAIPPGQKVGLVGESGAGKSTLTQLLLRMYDVQKGAIYIDGHDISKVTQDSLRTVISYVPQHSMLFHRSLKENIQYGHLKAADEAIFAAANHAGAHRFIMELPKTYDTLVGERGIKLSGGQAQRISIARAMLKQAPILILDEATSSLDSESEHMVQQALAQLIQNKTVIAIAHRLSTLLAMDRIIVLDQGQIAEDGTHETLLELDGIYAKLWKHQVGGYLTHVGQDVYPANL